MFAFSLLSFLFYELFLLKTPSGHPVPSILPIGFLNSLFRFNHLGGRIHFLMGLSSLKEIISA